MASFQLPEHFNPFNASLTLIWGCLDLKQWSIELNFLNLYFFTPNFFPPKRLKSSLLERILFSHIPVVGKAQKTARIAWTGCGVRFFAFTPDFAKISVRQKHKYGFFSKISNVKVCFCYYQSILCCLLDPGMFSLAL